MKYKGAIFDMDGLLFDTECMYQQTWREIAQEKNIKLDDSFTKAVSGTNGEHMRRVIEKYYHVSDGAAIQKECMERVKEKLSVSVPIKKGVQEILDFFQKKNIRMAVASSSSTEQIQSNLKIAGISEYFLSIVSGSEVKAGKPAPDIFIYAAEKIDCKPEECFVFEDSKNGIKAGYAAGCSTIMVPDVIEADAEIIPYCTKICSSLIEAKQEINNMLSDR